MRTITLFLFGACFALPIFGQSTPAIRSERIPLRNRLGKTVEAVTYQDLMDVDPTLRRRAMHSMPPDKQHELVTDHLETMLELYRKTLSTDQKRFIEATLEDLHPRDFVRRPAIDLGSVMRAWQGDRLGRMYRKTDVAALQELFPEALAREIFALY